MVLKKRLKNHKKRAMQRRLKGLKGPMTTEQKEANKKKREAQRAASKAALEAKK